MPDLTIRLNLPGEHNVRNALAAIAVGTELELNDQAISQALAAFQGVGRRFQRYGDWPLPQGGEITVVDDYGHHPAEMSAVLAAARGAFPGRRLILAFQPHRYTRTRDCFEDFVHVMGQADAVVLTEVYAAGESPIVAADSRALVRALRIAGKVDPLFIESVSEVSDALINLAADGDVMMIMGAGSIGSVAAQLVHKLGGNIV